MDKTLIKGLDVLTYIVRSERGVRITDVANDLNLSKSNAFRVLKTLEIAGFIRQNERTKEFSPTLRLWELGILAANQLNLRERAREALARLAAESRETVHLAVLDGNEVIYIEKIDSPEPVSAYTRLGGRAPAHCVATGKALLSELSDGDVDRVAGKLARHSPNTIVSPATLHAELAAIRKNGYAINRGEWRDTVWGLASPIRDATGIAVAAVGVSGPSFRIDDEQRCIALAHMVIRAAREISEDLR